MKVGSCFSGIGGFEIAAEHVFGPGSVAWQIEIDRFARRVLARHWPDVTRYEDIRTVDPGKLAPVDILCGGWPCQDNSVAGKRAGHAGERSGLYAEILRLVDGLDPRPRFLVLENVPGLASVAGGRDFAAAVHELRRRGYVGCVRRLDAQHFGLAQRRARLFFVAGLGAAGRAAVQLVLEGGGRYPAPRRKAGERVAPCIEAGANRTGGDRRPGDTVDTAETLVAGTLQASGAGRARPAGMASETDFLVAAPLTVKPYADHEAQESKLVCSPAVGERADDGALAAKWAKGTGGPSGDEAQNLVCYPLDMRNATRSSAPSKVNRQSLGVGAEGDPAPTLGTCFTPSITTLTAEGAGASEDGTGRGTPLVIQEAQTGVRVDPNAGALRADAPGTQPTGSLIAFGVSNQPTPKVGADLCPSLDAKQSGGGRMEAVSLGATVRRLTPTECERLQGLSWRDARGEWLDGHTCLCGRNRGRSWPLEDACTCPDGPRYRACGNAVAVPALVWLFRQVRRAAEMFGETD